MSNTNKNSALNVFNETYDRMQLLYRVPFTEIYPSEFDEITTALKDEISNNCILQNETQFNIYLNWVKDKIEKTYMHHPSKSFIEKWVKEYNLDEKDFPFYSNSKILTILATSFDQYNLSYEDKTIARLMQSDFFNHALLLEADKILEFINNLLNNGNITESTTPSLTNQYNKPKKIAEKWYALQYLLQLKANRSKPPINQEGALIKSEIEKIGRKRIANSTTGQSFYRSVQDHYNSINNSDMIKRTFGENWKEMILSLPNNTPETIEYLEII